tara:strand:- start:567 stop:1862 length:1296 start_codon:yes stop_codon:yes gene_type:complete
MKTYKIIILFILLFVIYKHLTSSKFTYFDLISIPSSNLKKYKNVGVIGGGISGLNFCKNTQNSLSVHLFEKKKKLGGNNYSSSEKIPMRFSCFLTYNSKALKDLVKELNLEVQKINSPELEIRNNNEIVKNSAIDTFNFLFFNYIPLILKFNFSKRLESINIKNELDFNNSIVNYNFKTMCGINLFSDFRDFDRLPSCMIARYLELAFKLNYEKHYETIKNGNHLLHEALVKNIKDNVNIQTNNLIKNIIIDDNKKIILNNKYKFDSIVICTQPHDASKILPKNLEPHQSIFKCFEIAKAYSCVHNYKNVFLKQDSKKCLAWEVIKNNHYLHIDAYFYKLPNIKRPRERFITVRYGSAPNIIPNKYIIEESFTLLSRQIQSKKKLLNDLLFKLKTNHSNIFLCNSAYYGFMWHADGVDISNNISKSFLNVL